MTGIDTVITTMVTYSLTSLIGWILLLVAWYFLGLPFGPEAPIFM